MKKNNNNVALLAGVGMVCATTLGCFYIVYKDNVKRIKAFVKPMNKLVDLGEKYIDLEHEDKINEENKENN